MQRLRFWIAALFLWFFALYNIERFHETINLASFAYVLSAVAGICLILLPVLQRVPLSWLLVLPVPLFFVLKLGLGYPIGGRNLPITVTEIMAIELTLLLARQTGRCLEEFREGVAESMLSRLNDRSRPFELGQGDIYREVRRARIHERPLAVLAIATAEETVKHAVNRLIDEVQRETMNEFFTARIGHLLSEAMKDSDIITRRNGHFVTLLPETDRDGGAALVKRLRQTAKEKLGVDLRVGLATFPEEEVTFEGLLRRAEAAIWSFAGAGNSEGELGPASKTNRLSGNRQAESGDEISVIRMEGADGGHRSPATSAGAGMLFPGCAAGAADICVEISGAAGPAVGQ